MIDCSLTFDVVNGLSRSAPCRFRQLTFEVWLRFRRKDNRGVRPEKRGTRVRTPIHKPCRETECSPLASCARNLPRYSMQRILRRDASEKLSRNAHHQETRELADKRRSRVDPPIRMLVVWSGLS